MARRALGPATLAVVQAVSALDAAAWLVACSGGADSVALARAAHLVATSRGTSLRAVCVDHGLQPGSDAVATGVVASLREAGLDAVAVRVAVGTRGGPEAAARDARYAALEASARPGERILLGHTLDDQAETVLLGLARGSGVRSLAGMPVERGPFLRPLLGLGREVTAACCAELGVEPWPDPMNTDRRFARVRVREVVLPVLEAELGPGIREALARTADLSRAASDLVGAVSAGETLTNPGDCALLRGLAPGLRRQALRDWLGAAGAADVRAVHVDQVERLVVDWHGQRGVDVPGGRVSRIDGRLRWTPRALG